MRSTACALLASLIAIPSGFGAVIANGGFDSGSLDPWYTDRQFGLTRPWTVGSLDPHSGGFYAFNLGPLELRQDFAAVLGSGIAQFSFFVAHQFPNRGNPMIEVFYSDGGSSGLREIALDPTHATGSSSSGWIWDEVNLIPYVDSGRSVSGVSVVGIPNNTFSVDSFSLTTVPEPSSSSLIIALCMAMRIRRARSNKASLPTPDPPLVPAS